ncbi:MAG: single-stranded-DNA-specific exonuclease RecJ, partial [Bacteroidota bacterium]
MQKIWQATEYDASTADQLQKELNIHPVFCQLLAQRGISSFQEAEQFFRPKISDLHDPFLMKGMEKAATRVLQAIDNQEKVLIYGDYDADGVTSVSLLYSFLAPLVKSLDYYIPDRYKEGYGLSYEGVEFAYQAKVDLLITVDCGITATAQIKLVKYYNIDCIICDHHLPEKTLPLADAILDPKQIDCNYPYKELSGCGIAFKLAQGINQKLERPFQYCKDLLDLVAISTAADIVEMRGENRVLMYYGLKQLNNTKRVGLKMLLQMSGREMPLNVSDIVFGIAPLINAAGRLADAKQAVKLLLAKDKNAAADLSHLLQLRNKMRQEFDQRIAQEAKELFEQQENWQEKNSIVLYQKHWHKGVVGIVASRMVDQYYRPSIILTESNDQVVGSARSIKGIDIHAALHHCADLLVNFGGHQHAAGLKMQIENLPFFQDRIEAYVSTHLKKEEKLPRISYHAQLDFKDITPTFWNILQQFAPFGPGNRNPVFVTKAVIDTGYSRILKGEHLKFSVKQKDSSTLSGIGFGLGKKYELMQGKQSVNLCYNLQLNKWKGKRSIQLVVKDLKSS